MIEYIEYGDIFKLKGVNSYAHGCNCAGAMGKGIALEFKSRYPAMYNEYKKLCLEKKFRLGEVFVYSEDNETVFNLGTQATWKTKANINAIKESIEKMLFIANERKIKKIALPKIGAGLGGLNWDSVKEVLNEVIKDYKEVSLFVIENYKP